MDISVVRSAVPQEYSVREKENGKYDTVVRSTVGMWLVSLVEKYASPFLLLPCVSS